MSWWKSWSTRRRATVVVAVVTVVAGSVGAAYAVTGSEDDVAQASPSPTKSTYGPFAPTTSSDTSSGTSSDTDDEGGDAASTETSSLGRIVVVIDASGGQGRPTEVGANALDIDTGAEVGTPGQIGSWPKSVTIDDVPAGRYNVIAGSDDNGWEAAWAGQTSGIDADRSQAQIVEVTPGETVTVTVKLIFWPGGERPDSSGSDTGEDTDPPTPTPTSTTPSTEPVSAP